VSILSQKAGSFTKPGLWFLFKEDWGYVRRGGNKRWIE
jgi:hypothetical protein